jgi:uncharacterized coiled-coil protein SlyX
MNMNVSVDPQSIVILTQQLKLKDQEIERLSSQVAESQAKISKLSLSFKE